MTSDTMHSESDLHRIAGHLVAFPRKPYGVQKAFMSSLIGALEARTHALLEAPTGTGKTLATLCGVLAWQTQQKKVAAGGGAEPGARAVAVAHLA